MDFVKCVHSSCGAVFTSTSAPLPTAEVDGKGPCPACENYELKGFLRGTFARDGSTFAEKWPGARRLTVFASAVIKHLDKLGLDEIDLAILVFYEAHNYGGADKGAFPATKTVSGALSIGESTVRTRLRQMVGAGYCEKRSRFGGNGSQLPSVYTRLGLARVAAFIDANEQQEDGRWVVPGLADFLAGLGPRPLASDAAPLAGHASPLAGHATKEVAVGEVQIEEGLLSELDPSDPALTDDADAHVMTSEFDAVQVTGAEAHGQWWEALV